MKGSQEWGGLKPGIGIIMGDMKFLKSIYIVGRGWLTPCFTKTSSLYCLPPSFSNFFHHFFHFPVTSNPILTVLSVVLFLWLNSWSHYIRCAILLNDNMDLHILSLGTRRTLMCVCVFYATKCQVYWVLTGNVGFYWYPFIFYHIHKHTNIHSTFRGQ